MYQLTSKLLMYSDFGADSILMRLSDIFRDWEAGSCAKEALISRIYAEVRRLLDLATDYGFNDNLWHNYLAFLLINDENPFSLTCEKAGASDGSANHFAKNDFAIFKALFDFDFGPVERDLGIDCFSVLSDYRAIPKKKGIYNQNVSDRVRAVSRAIEQAADADAVFRIVTGFYRDWGVGMLGLNRAFRIAGTGDTLSLVPINNMDQVVLSDLVGYESQKRELVANTEAFLEGKIANNVLLYGDSGTGKSTSIKAIVNQYWDRGLRMIEIYKHQFKDLSGIIARIKNRNYRFIIYMDDLSFEEFEIEYKFLKAVIEGGVETRPENVLIYATSNRRHLIKESFDDRSDMQHSGDVHASETMEEKLSLANRFGVSILFMRPSRQEFYDIVLELAHRQQLGIPDDVLTAEASRWEIRHPGVSGRLAQQFINHLLGQKE